MSCQVVSNRIKPYNILVVGNTGVGKSTLIGTISQIYTSDTVTTKISEKPYTTPGSLFALYDTPGLERDKKQRNQVKQDVAHLIQQQKQWRKEPEEHIHAVWYCINSQITRGCDIDQKWIADLAKEVPVIAVITRSLSKEKSQFQKQLETKPNIRHVVPVLAEAENTNNGLVNSHGLKLLLATTEKLLEEIAQTAILNAVNSKANEAFGWCRDGCAKVLATQLLPIPPVFKAPAASLIQTRLFVDISKTFGCEFEQSFITQLRTVELRAVGLSAVGFDILVEKALKNLPIDYNNIQTVKDVFSHLTTTLEQVAGELPFKEQLLEILSVVANCNLISGLPILSCITTIATTLSTGVIAVACIEALKIYKIAEYKGQPLSLEELKKIRDEQLNWLSKLCANGWEGEDGVLAL